MSVLFERSYTYPLGKYDLWDTKPGSLAERVRSTVMDHGQGVAMLQHGMGVIDPLLQTDSAMGIGQESWV